MLLCLYHLQDGIAEDARRKGGRGGLASRPALLTCALAPDTPPGNTPTYFPDFFFPPFSTLPTTATFPKSRTPVRTS